MDTLSRSAVAVVALVASLALVGGLAGCVEDGWYYASGEPPVVAPPPGASPDCQIEVAPQSPAGSTDPRAPHASPAARSTSARVLREPNPPAGDLEPAAFKTAPCQRNATD
jgi:hypothetical protein